MTPRHPALTRSLPGEREKGVFVVLMAVALLVVVAVIGLAMDAGMMFVTRQQIQAAADAAAQSGIMDMYNATYSTGTYGASQVCAAGSAWTPCYYARVNGLPSDSVKVDFPAAAPAWGTACSTPNGGNAGGSYICVTVSRTVNTALVRVLGTTASTVTATAAAGIVYGPAALPIVVTHPHLKDAFSTGGNSTVTITGGPSRTIQINSDGTGSATGTPSGSDQAFSIGGSSFVNISGAGPNGTGGAFRSWGPKDPAVTALATVANTTACSGKQICLGTTGTYNQPASIIGDPFAALAQPTLPAAAGTVTGDIASGSSLGVAGCTATCPANAVKSKCRVYRPGTYPAGINVKGHAAYFAPGLYYITSADSGNNANGFTGDSNSDMQLLSTLCPNVVDAGSADFSQGGILVFNAGDGAFGVGSNGSALLRGADVASTKYEGILFWADRTHLPPANKPVILNTFGGGGAMTLRGTIYANMQPSSVTLSRYQQVRLQGNGGSTTQLVGEIITNVLDLGGTGDIRMTLSSALVNNVRQVALIR